MGHGPSLQVPRQAAGFCRRTSAQTWSGLEGGRFDQCLRNAGVAQETCKRTLWAWLAATVVVAWEHDRGGRGPGRALSGEPAE